MPCCIFWIHRNPLVGEKPIPTQDRHSGTLLLLKKKKNDSKMACVLWHLRCLLHGRLRPVSSKAHGLLTQIFTHPVIFNITQTSRFSAMWTLPALCTPENLTKQLLALDKRQPYSYKSPGSCCPSEFSDSETPGGATE